MSDKTGIEWTDATWNPTRGCTRVSEGCRHCYAEGVAYRFSGPGEPYEKLVQIGADGKRRAQWNGNIRFVEEALFTPLRWKRPRRIFVNSMSDLFHEGVTDEQLDRIFALMALCPQHTFQVLTKRPERMREYFAERYLNNRIGREINIFADDPKLINVPLDVPGWGTSPRGSEWDPLENVWLGVSVEEARWKSRIDELRVVPAALRFLSLEPLLGELGPLDLTGIDWVIAGGESGPGARPMHPDWVRSVRNQCVAAGVPFFFKQWGEWLPSKVVPVVLSARAAELGGRCFDSVFLPDKPREELLKSGKTKDCDIRAALLGKGGTTLYRVGKKAAGDLLDGVQWHQFPGDSSASVEAGQR